MNKQNALHLLQEHKETIYQRFGVRHLSLFGSTVRDEAREKSDVDVLVEFDGPATSDRYFGLQFYLEDLFGCPVDLVTDKALRPELRPYIEKEAIRVA
ncbi:MAG TPA: nucleotidyltransferase family protein [Thiobacillus sp.]|nr:MAG: DNA polymerase subunit beta [Hydrogenophilales bacterium 16-61-112]OZA50341.1 MAG: DNA polymerase subunit beta [Hydrogenophilales bacterium 17-61-76]HQT30428.1 nucleotidyltransferase family protein [Thiobacillus sp.]HQT68960.1 nucleotidyltransferase family protein [Thiobacillus sp.]